MGKGEALRGTDNVNGKKRGGRKDGGERCGWPGKQREGVSRRRRKAITDGKTEECARVEERTGTEEKEDMRKEIRKARL